MTSIDPQAVTFVRASKPNLSRWYRTAQDRLRVESGESQAFMRFRASVPRRRELVSATLEARAEDPWSGTATARSVAHDSGAYKPMTWASRPAVVSGSVDRTATVSNRALSWDVSADVTAAVAANRWGVAFRVSSSSGTAQWLRTASVQLVLVTRAVSSDPTDLSPSGLVGTAKPTWTWTAPAGITKTQLQVSTASTFASTVYDSGELNNTSPEVDTAMGPAWAGLSGTMYVRARHFTAAGWSGWQSVTVEHLAPVNFVVSNPVAADADATPPSVWSPAAQAVEIITFRDGRRVGTTGLVAGPISTLTPDEGARKSGQVLKRVHRFYDGQPRTEPAFVTRVTETTFTPTGTVAGLTSISPVQVGDLPVVEVSWARGTVPDEVALWHGDDFSDLVPGTAPARDWTVSPNSDVVYGGRAVVNGQQSSTIRTQTIRTRIGGVWLVDPVTERGFTLSGTDELEIGYGGEVVVHTPIDGAVLLRRTLTRRGPEGSIGGSLDPLDSVALWTNAEQLENVEWMADRPERVYRLICGDLNVPVVTSGLQAVFDPELARYERMWHRVSFAFSHAGGY